MSGVLLRRTYTEGSQVRAGQLLFEIDPAFYRAQLDNDLALLAQDQATYINDRITAARNRKLLPVGSVSQQTVDNSDAAERSAAAKVKADQAAVESARISLNYTRVTSPISGIAGQQQATAGAVVGTSTVRHGRQRHAADHGPADRPDVRQLHDQFVRSGDAAAVRRATARFELQQQKQTEVHIGLPNHTQYGTAGTLDFSDVSVNAATGAINMRALVANSQRRLLPGMYVTLIVNFGQQNNVFLVPQQALQRDTVGGYVFVVGADGKVARKDVEAHDSQGNNWIVTHGLTDGDEIIVTGVQMAQRRRAGENRRVAAAGGGLGGGGGRLRGPRAACVGFCGFCGVGSVSPGSGQQGGVGDRSCRIFSSTVPSSRGSSRF